MIKSGPDSLNAQQVKKTPGNIFKKRNHFTQNTREVFWGGDENMKEQLQKWQANSEQLIANI